MLLGSWLCPLPTVLVLYCNLLTVVKYKEFLSLSLIVKLRALGVTDGKYVLLEEKLGIFLYTCVVSLAWVASRLVGERFQRSKDTLTR